MEILASSKTGANKYDLLENDPLKVLTRLDARQLAEALQYLVEVTQGYSLSGDEGSSDALVTNLSIINTANIATYKPKLTQALQTLIAHQNTLAVDGTSTANAIVLVPKKISADVAPNAVDYTIVAPLPLKWQDDLQFTFRATIANTTATTLSIPSLSGLSGAVDLLDESESVLVGGEITIGKYVTVVTKTISGNKKFILRKALVTEASTTAKGIVELLTNAELAAGTDTTRAATAAALASLFGTSDRSANGYIRLPIKVGGAFVEIIIQFGSTSSISQGSNVSVTLPVTFPTAILHAYATSVSTANNTNNYSVSTNSPTASGFSVTNNSGTSGVVSSRWIAIGY